MVSKEPPGYRHFEEFLRKHIADPKTLAEALAHLKFLRTERESMWVGVRATLEYMLAHNELPRENHPEPQICLVPDDVPADPRDANSSR
jgi:hypothetical protein